MKISLVFPPPFDITQPYLSVPTLSAFLKQNGYQTVQRDLNVEIFDHFVDATTLSATCARIRTRLDEARGRQSPQDDARIAALERANSISPALIPLCADVKRGFRESAEFFRPEAYAKSLRLLHRVCESVSAAFFPTVLTPVSFRMRYQRSSVAQILAAIGDEMENPFIAPFRDVFVPSLLAAEPDLFGLSVVYSDQIIPALTLARLLKQAKADTMIVAGGDVFSRMSRTHLAGMAPFFDLVDAFVVDDGRQPLLTICERLQAGEPLDGIPRVLTRHSDHVPLRPTSFDPLPTPDYAGLATDLYFSPEPIFSLLAGKGCKWGRCTFCTESFTKDYFPKPMPSLVADIAHLVETYGVRSINFADVDISLARMRELAEELLTRGLQVSWSSRARLEKGIDDDLCKLIARAGCRKLYFGLESASQRVLNRMRKGTLIDRVPEMLRSCWENGIAVHLFSFVGFPGETREEARTTMEFLAANGRYVSSFNIGNFYFRTFSDIYREAETYGVRPAPEEEADADLDQQDYVVDHGMAMEEAEEMSYVLSRGAYELLARVDSSFEIFPSSRYVKKKWFPAFDSHNLAYLARYSNRWVPDESAVERYALHDDATLAVQPFVELQRDADDTCIVFSSRSAKVLRLPAGAIELFKACDGRTPLRSLRSRYGAAKAPSGGRRGGGRMEAAPDAILALLAKALREGIVAAVGAP